MCGFVVSAIYLLIGRVFNVVLLEEGMYVIWRSVETVDGGL